LVKEEVMAYTESEWSKQQAAELHARAAEARRLADRLRLAGYRDQAARHLLDARLHDLRAAAFRATARAA
jgi:hypothetical protein